MRSSTSSLLALMLLFLISLAGCGSQSAADSGEDEGRGSPILSATETTESRSHPSPSEATQTATLTNTEEAFRIQAEMYAESVGVSVEEAMRRLELQAEVGQLRAELMTNERDVMSEVRIVHEPDFGVIVYVVPGGEERVRAYVADGPLSEITTIETVPYTEDQLLADLDAADALLQPLGIPYAASISEKDVQIYVADREEVLARLGQKASQIPRSVQIIEVSQLPENASG